MGNDTLGITTEVAKSPQPKALPWADRRWPLLGVTYRLPYTPGRRC